MKIRHQLLIVILSIVVIVSGVSYYIKSSVSEKNKDFLTGELTETKNSISKKTFEIINKKSSNLLYNYSVWNNMANLINQKKSSAEIHEELSNTLLKYEQVKYVWVLDKAARDFYSINADNLNMAGELQMKPGLLNYSLQISPFRHFFINHNNSLLEVFTAPVQSTEMALTSTEPTGYIMIGSIVDSSYLTELNEWEKEIKFTLANTAAKDELFADEFNTSKGFLQFSVPLNDISNKPVAAFNVQKKFPVLISYQENINKYMLSFVGIVFVIAIITYLSIRKIIIYPLKQLTLSLQNKSSQNLAPLNKETTEFGELSKLITNFFDQNEILAIEIEQRKMSEAHLQKALKEKEIADVEKIRAEQSVLAKSQFLSTMSHEIRTPINGVIGISNLLMEENLNARQAEYVKTLNFSAQNLLSIVSDILDFSKIEAGKMEFEKSSFNLQEVSQNVFNLFEQKAQEKGIEYSFIPGKAAAFSYYGDHHRLSQVLSNLLSNALKFTDAGRVELSYTIEKENTDEVEVKFMIKDSGIGLTNEQQLKIFESFSQADKHITARYGGTGLGLTICKKLIEMQGGTIAVQSEFGKGSTFIVTIKYDKHAFTAENGNATIDLEKTSVKNLKGLKILVAEDNHVNAMVLTRFLNKWNIENKVAKDGVEAIELLKNESFDVVLMDLQMPNMDGHQAMKIIRDSAERQIKNMPVIAFTADALLETQKKLISTGFDNCMTKPFNPDSLYKLLSKYYSAA